MFTTLSRCHTKMYRHTGTTGTQAPMLLVVGGAKAELAPGWARAYTTQMRPTLPVVNETR